MVGSQDAGVVGEVLLVQGNGLIEPARSLVWTAGGFSDSACFVLQAAFFRTRKSLSASFGVRYPRAE